MRALVCREWGDPTKSRAEGGVLGVEDVPPWTRPPRGIRVRVICASLNFADCLLVRNLYQGEARAAVHARRRVLRGRARARGRAPEGRAVPGRAGGRRGGRRGRRHGGGAGRARTRARPRSSSPRISPAAASSFPIAYGTAYMALAQRARVGPGTRVLVLGAGGGVGLAAVQIAKALGAVVVAALAARRKSRRAAPPAPTRAWTATRCTRRQTRSTRMYTKKKRRRRSSRSRRRRAPRSEREISPTCCSTPWAATRFTEGCPRSGGAARRS